MGLFSSSTTQNIDSHTSPWAPQAGALIEGFQGAQNAYNTAAHNAGNAPTDFTAGMTPDQLATFQAMAGYGSQVPGAAGNAAIGALGAGANATNAALSGYSGFDPTAALSGPSLMNTAQGYVNSQNIPAQVRQAMQQGLETARDTVLPGITQNAAISGNADSSRAGIAQGIVQRGLAENAQNLYGSLSNQAWQNGLNLASSNANASNAALLQKLQSLGVLGVGNTNAGVNAGTNSIQNQGALFGINAAGGMGEQAGNQADLTNQLQRYQFGQNSPFDATRNFMGIVGSNNWGSDTHGTQTTTSNPSATSIIGGLLGTGASLFGGGGLMGAGSAFGSGGMLSGLFGGGGGPITYGGPNGPTAFY